MSTTLNKETGEESATATDPVCGMSVDPLAGKPSAEYRGVTYHFCCERCHTRFVVNPESFLNPKEDAEPPPPGTLYTCSMCPEIVQEGPGTCPKCGMALEPMGVPTGDEGPDPELVDFTRRLWIGAIFTLPLLIVAMGPVAGLPVRDWLGHRAAAWVELALATPIVFWAALPFLSAADIAR